MAGPSEVAAATRRAVGNRSVEGKEAAAVTLSHEFPVSAEELWDTCTKADRLAKWFLPISGDLRRGGRFQLEGNAGGTIETCEPGRSFSATWEYAGEISWIECEITEAADGGAYLTLSHVAHLDDEHWPKYGPGAAGVGWDLGLLGLKLYLDGVRENAPEADPAWVASPEGIRFINTASESWRQAHVASGAPVDQAESAAQNTAAFYTGAEHQGAVADR